MIDSRLPQGIHCSKPLAGMKVPSAPGGSGETIWSRRSEGPTSSRLPGGSDDPSAPDEQTEDPFWSVKKNELSLQKYREVDH